MKLWSISKSLLETIKILQLGRLEETVENPMIPVQTSSDLRYGLIEEVQLEE